MPDCITIEEIKTELLIRFPSISESDLEDLAFAVVDIVGGKYVAGRRFLKSKRNSSILSAFNGHNISEVAAIHHLSQRQVRRLIHKVTQVG